MRIVLHGGFAEKGRTCVGVESGGFRLLLDAGVKTSARGGPDYYPSISPSQLAATDAIIVTHGHEDHVAALGWLLASGLRGRIFMTPETQRDTGLCLPGYAEPAHHRLVQQARVEPLPLGEDALRLGPLRITTGRSGHVAGGVWCCIDDGRVRFQYCGDVVPASPVFGMDPLPRCDAIAIDASYGDDGTSTRERARQVAGWIEAHPQGSVLPTPLYGRSAELLAIVPGAIALAPGMREALQAQIDDAAWLVPGMAAHLSSRLDAASEWTTGSVLPRAALLCHDGMGMAGPSREILAMAQGEGHAVLFTGHVPAGSAGERMIREHGAAWIRLPTHPTLPENLALVASARATTVLGHSCERGGLEALSRHLPSLNKSLSTGESLDL